MKNDKRHRVLPDAARAGVDQYHHKRSTLSSHQTQICATIATGDSRGSDCPARQFLRLILPDDLDDRATTSLSTRCTKGDKEGNGLAAAQLTHV
jgi:hypothetical protein